ncbi:MobV family relaxase [Burkholderia multivorans]|uniref:MobV family relaxase n=1 Tax=Burkholderia multivorans TaxID=87883 RepID=UPI000A70FA6E|nr:MobV family relaxase [Burkholderia multivorans]
MSYPTVIRTAKLSSMAAVKGSGRHTWRECGTPNADPSRTPANSDWRSVRNADELADAVARRVGLATEIAQKPVLCIEYLITAKSDAFTERGGQVNSEEYFRDALRWLENRHGAENVVAVNIQRDETAPHLVAYVVPLVEIAAKTRRRSVITGTNADGTKRRETREFAQAGCVRLSAAHFQGTPAKLRALQGDFAASVGARHGLVRGVEGSRADHQTIKQWYTTGRPR